MNFQKQILVFVLLISLSISLLSGCGTQKQQISRNGFFFDTIITITLYGTDNESYINSCFSLASDYEKKFSNTIKDSEISKINQNAGSYVSVSDETIELLTDAIEYGNISGGKFDVTIGNLSDLWNFSEIAKNSGSPDNKVDSSVVPSDEEIKKQLSHVNYHCIQIDGNRVKLTDPDSKLDVGGIAKGYIADKMRTYLNQEGITSGVISLGGNVLTLGSKTDNKPYTIGIQKPFADTGTPLAELRVKDASIVSSGIYERYYRVGDKLYHHILDTETGYPVENNLYQVTIISQSSMDGDALSTTCFALGLEKGMELIEETDGIEAVFVTDDGNLHYSSGIGDNEELSLKQL